jgi:hypothetical protein
MAWSREEIAFAFFSLSNEERIQLKQPAHLELNGDVQLDSIYINEFLDSVESNNNDVASGSTPCKAFQVAAKLDRSRQEGLLQFAALFREAYRDA